jgi:hypothetical protein
VVSVTDPHCRILGFLDRVVRLHRQLFYNHLRLDCVFDLTCLCNTRGLHVFGSVRAYFRLDNIKTEDLHGQAEKPDGF